MNNDDIPYIAFEDKSNNSLSVIKFNGKEWQNIGPNAKVNSNNDIKEAFEIGEDGDLYLAYLAADQNNKIIVTKFDGENWYPVDDEISSVGQASKIALNFDGYGDLYLSYIDANNKANIKLYNGHNWANVGDFSHFTDSILDLKLQIDDWGQPYIAYLNLKGSLEIMTLNGNNCWEEISKPDITNISGFEFKINRSTREFFLLYNLKDNHYKVNVSLLDMS